MPSRPHRQKTYLFIGTISHILVSLFETYYGIIAQTLATKKSTVKEITYNHTKPLAAIFHNINKYSTMYKASGAPATTAQLIDMAWLQLPMPIFFPMTSGSGMKRHFYRRLGKHSNSTSPNPQRPSRNPSHSRDYPIFDSINQPTPKKSPTRYMHASPPRRPRK